LVFNSSTEDGYFRNVGLSFFFYTEERRIRTADSPHVLLPVPQRCEVSGDNQLFFMALSQNYTTIIFVMSVRPSVRTHGTTERIFMKFDTGVFF
jgi:hypothetical protein